MSDPKQPTNNLPEANESIREFGRKSAKQIRINKPTAPVGAPIGRDKDAIPIVNEAAPGAREKSKPPVVPDAPVAMPAPQITRAPNESDIELALTEKLKFPHESPDLPLVVSQTGRLYAEMNERSNKYLLAIRSPAIRKVVKTAMKAVGIVPKRSLIDDFIDDLAEYAETEGQHVKAWYRVAPIKGGIEVDLGDDEHTRIEITKKGVRIVTQGSNTLFYRAPVTRPFVKPAEVGDLDLLKKYLNMNAVDRTLLIAWLTYTLAHPKLPTTNFVILILQGDQGSGKTVLSKLILMLVDPSSLDAQTLRGNEKDFAIAAANAHVLCYDNVRWFNPNTSDLLCRAATGSSLSSRALYTDEGQVVQHLHAALVLNGIHDFVSQPDLADRSLPIHLHRLSEGNRKSEAQLALELETDLPKILRGLFDLTAKIFAELPNATPTEPGRMIDFSRWLAAMEKADGVELGIYQAAYHHTLQEAQLDTLLDNPLAAALFEFVRALKDDRWTGKPADLFDDLNCLVPIETKRSRHWPPSPSSLSKRLKPLEAALRDQGVEIERHRGKNRNITIRRREGFNND